MTSTKSDFAEISFDKITIPSTTPTGSQLDINSYGSCSVINYNYQGTPPLNNFGSITYLDAGPSISAMGPASFGTKSIPELTYGGPYYSAQLDQTATTLVPGAYTFTGTGGADVGAFTANYTLPQIFTWTDPSTITSVTRGSSVTVHWSGGNPSGYVTHPWDELNRHHQRGIHLHGARQRRKFQYALRSAAGHPALGVLWRGFTFGGNV